VNGQSASVVIGNEMPIDDDRFLIIENGRKIEIPALQSGSTAVRRVEIPKPAGGMRALAIPTVLDRFIQQAVLQSQWDATFSPSSYGLRPGRSAHQAVARAQQLIAAGWRSVVDIARPVLV
jgi:retron-type reverse transcriptase